MKKGFALALTVLALVAVAAVGRTGGCVSDALDGRQAHRGGGNVPLPADFEVDPGGRLFARDRPHVRIGRIRRRDRTDHRPHGRLRGVRRTAVARPAHRLQRLSRDPVGLGRHVGDVQPARSCEASPAHRPGAREHLPRPDHAVERCGDPGSQSRRDAARHEDHRRASLGRVRDDVQLHRVPLFGQSFVEEHRGIRHGGQLAGRCRRPR